MSGKLIVIEAWSEEAQPGRQTATVSTAGAYVTIDRLTEPRGAKATLTLVPFARGEDRDRLISALQAARNYRSDILSARATCSSWISRASSCGSGKTRRRMEGPRRVLPRA